MKVPLEPIPTEQIVLAKEKPPRTSMMAPDTRHPIITPAVPQDSGQLEKAYPWLLGVSTCLSALLCWMYVSKPVIVQETAVSSQPQEIIEPAAPKPKLVEQTTQVTTNRVAELVPSDNQLPSAGNTKVASASGQPEMVIDPRATSRASRDAAEAGVVPGWEKTNLKVQHILSADLGTGEHERIVLNVPVLYESRNMRWTPTDIEKAREILARLMLYERNLSNLRKESHVILADWNHLLKQTVPATSLRADSPSLPYNQGQQLSPTLLPESSLIKVENP